MCSRDLPLLERKSTNMDSNELPVRQKDVLNLIAQLTDENGYPPTLAELAKALGLKNRMTVHQHVAALKKKGFVQWEPGLNRSLRVISDSPSKGKTVFKEKEEAKPAGIPLAGTIAAGRPIDAIQSSEYIEIDGNHAKEGCFALKVKGDSMIEEGIFDGDYVIIKPNPAPRNGEIVVALLDDGSATLKRFYKENGKFRLQPANKEYKPIVLDQYEDIQIQGTVVALYRKL
ncbi:MAG: repressor LexA [Candidatus Melainabacteria bacterium]|nr:MAG: repressor LexA [Candidatus Melainabacteria bacterium]